MSVLIEALTLLVRRRAFDSAYPGGADAFISASLANPCAPRFACADDPHLLNLSFEHADHATHAIELLQLAGLKGLDESIPELIDYVLVDAISGPTIRVSWLGFKKHEDGFSFAWILAEPVGAVAGPAEWIRQRRQDNERAVLGDDSDQLMLLASENGIRTYLDLSTGALNEIGATAAPSAARPGGPNRDGRFGVAYLTPSDESTFGGRLNRLLALALSELGWNTLIAGPPFFVVQYASARAVYSCKYFVAEETNVISCSVLAPLIIPVKHRRRVLEYISRLNCEFALGGFDLNLDNGALFFRAGIALGDQDPTPTMVADIAQVGVAVMDRYFARVLEISSGARSVIDAAGAPPE
jgi:hypothetical protein